MRKTKVPNAKAATSEEPTILRETEAEYTLEYAAVCPHCNRDLTTVGIVRIIRTRVNFTSMLPRRGRVAICLACRKILSVELTMA